jgi:hypothetical protein
MAKREEVEMVWLELLLLRSLFQRLFNLLLMLLLLLLLMLLPAPLGWLGSPLLCGYRHSFPS